MQAEKLRKLDQSFHLHPFTHHKDLHAQGTFIVDSAEGVYVRDVEGRRLLDGLAGLWCVNVGHGRQEIVEAVRKQMEKLAFYPSFFNTTTEATILLAEELARRAPTRPGGWRVFFSDSGSEANESALKMIRGYWKIQGKPARTKILTQAFAYHGVTVATTSMTHIASCQEPFGLPLPGFVQVPGPYRWMMRPELGAEAEAEYVAWALGETEKIIVREGASTIAALFAEPVQGAGGVVTPPAGYLAGLRAICRKHEILFCADEVITAFGRVGAWFASELWSLEPDLITTAKGITSGYLPLGATLVSGAVGQTLIDGGYLATGHTYSGHPAACAAALANLEILSREKLVERVRDTAGPYFQHKLREFAKHPAVGEVRGHGLIGALELLPREGRAGISAKTPLGPKAVRLAREQGVIVRGIRDLMAVAPPLTITEGEMDEMFAVVGKTLDRLWS